MKVLDKDLINYPKINLGRSKNIEGQKFGSLTALYRTISPKGSNNAYWIFKCDCGNYSYNLAQNVI